MPRLLSNPVLLQLARCSGYSKLPTVIDTKGTYNHLVWDLYPGLVPISGCWIPLYTYTGFQREGWGKGEAKGRRFITQHFGHGADRPRLSQCYVVICVVPNSDRDKYPS